MKVIGIDPGNSGAAAFVSDRGIFAVRDMPVVDGWINSAALDALIGGWIQHGEPDMAVVEKVRSMPKQGVASTFKFGSAWGMARQVVAGIPLEEPAPGTWKKAMGLTGKSKDASRAMAINLWPESADLFARKKDDGRAESALLAEYGRRLLAERGQG